ncbi:MAG: hypothetical protein A3F14_02185 [Gammaproteobacteria bacterium RIFCSPHIGHO2_12_FULL_43_28]|nr:MAG: hypothetical protein A3F14_02185 [Gammaproteobacteria bacterium RIFCSPHIGHO2_12_FULL_43_28]
MQETTTHSAKPPYKSVAVALLFSVLLGPLGLLYASFWGGVAMIGLAMLVFSAKLLFTSSLFWISCSIWAVGAVESYNRRLAKSET